MEYTSTDVFFGMIIFLSFLLFIGSIIDYTIGGPVSSFLASSLNLDKGLVSFFPSIFFIFILIANFISYYYLDPRNADHDETTGEQKRLNEQLRDAARNGKLELVKAALEGGAQIDAGGHGGRTALMNAVHGINYKPNLEVVEWLVENGADVNAEDAFGNKVIHYAYSDLPEYEEIIDYLKDHGAEGFSEFYYAGQL